MNNVDKQYIALLQDIKANGNIKGDRTGTGTKSVFGRSVKFNMSEGFPILTTKKIYFQGIKAELVWFLKGRHDLRYLLQNKCKIWVGDAYKHYKKYNELQDPQLSEEIFIEKILTDSDFSEEWGDLGPIYGKQWRDWNDSVAEFEGIAGIDQISQLLTDLKQNPDSRRLMVNAWNVNEIGHMILPPCHYGFQVYTRELTKEEKDQMLSIMGFDALTKEGKESFLKENDLPTRTISLKWIQRSVDTPLGLPFNITSYALLLEILGKIVNMIPEELSGDLGDTHIYLNQFNGVEEQCNRTSFKLPKLKFSEEAEHHFEYIRKNKMPNDLYKNYDRLFELMEPNWFTLEDYKCHPTIDYPLSN